MKLKLLVAAAVLALAIPAFAHAPKPSHGGRIVMTSAFHVEMVVKDHTVDVHLLGHDDKAIAVKGFKGFAILAAGGKNERIVLEPSDDAQVLSGKATVPLPKETKGVVQITPPEGRVVSAKFD